MGRQLQKHARTEGEMCSVKCDPCPLLHYDQIWACCRLESSRAKNAGVLWVETPEHQPDLTQIHFGSWRRHPNATPRASRNHRLPPPCLRWPVAIAKAWISQCCQLKNWLYSSFWEAYILLIFTACVEIHGKGGWTVIVLTFDIIVRDIWLILHQTSEQSRFLSKRNSMTNAGAVKLTSIWSVFIQKLKCIKFLDSKILQNGKWAHGG